MQLVMRKKTADSEVVGRPEMPQPDTCHRWTWGIDRCRRACLPYLDCPGQREWEKGPAPRMLTASSPKLHGEGECVVRAAAASCCVVHRIVARRRRAHLLAWGAPWGHVQRRAIGRRRTSPPIPRVRERVACTAGSHARRQLSVMCRPPRAPPSAPRGRAMSSCGAGRRWRRHAHRPSAGAAPTH